jgi:hypothetical protein
VTTLLGYSAHLVLKDERGEFEVADFLLESPDAKLNIDRVFDAIDRREEEGKGQQRPVY